MLRLNTHPLLNLALAFALATSVGAAPRLGLAQAPAAGDQPPAEAAAMLSAKELDKLVGPIALYPDDLIAVVMPASTFPLDVVRAARFLEQRKKNSKLKPSDQWDASVLGLLNYPEVIEMMNKDLRWTERFGTAVINQQKAVMDAIQQFRQRAQAAGNLQSNKQQVIVEEKETIIIKSATPEVIYVPSYDPAVVVVHQPTPVVYAYSTPYPYYYSPAATFWTGMFVGAAISYGINGYRGWGGGDVNINRNTNISRGGNTINRGGNSVNRGGGSTWKPSTRPAGRPGGANRPGNRPGYGGGGANRPGAGNRPAQRPSTGNRAAQRPSTGNRAAQRPSTGNRAAQRPSTGNRTAQRGTRSSQQRSRGSSHGSFGNYSRGTHANRSSNRGSSSRSASRGSRSSAGSRSSRSARSRPSGGARRGGGGGRSRGGRRR